MSWRTNPKIIQIRNAARVFGINRIIARLINRKGYEYEYDNALRNNLKVGDCVWDVGANIGHYSKIFSTIVQSTGYVISFEPSKINYLRLSHHCSNISNIQLIPYGLGISNMATPFEQGLDELGATSRINLKSSADTVDIRRADYLIENEKIRKPNVLKIDVEGFEYEVLVGFGSHLFDEQLRVIGIEIHFQIMQERGTVEHLRKIETILLDSGFQIRWYDSSHIIAHRK